MKAESVLGAIEKHRGERGALISILEAIQSQYGYLPEEALRLLAQRTQRRLIDIYGVATFYRSFSLEPRGKHLCSVCQGTACHVRGAPVVAEEFRRRLDVEPGGTTADREFTLETVNCLGACALGPIVTIDGHYFSNVRKAEVARLLEAAREGTERFEPGDDDRRFPLDISCPRCNHSLMDTVHLVDGHPSVHVTIAHGLRHGWLRLSSLYGSYRIESEHDIPMDAVADFFCPHCHAELTGASHCPDCENPMVPMVVRGGGIVQICARRGCRGHMLDLSGINA